MIRCIIYTDAEKTQESVLVPGEHLIGRSRSADIHLAQPDISGKHLKLEVRPDGVTAENLSSHGTLLNGNPLLEKTELKEGDRLSLGKHIGIKFGFSAENGPAAPQPPSEDAGEAPTFVPGATAPTPSPASAPLEAASSGAGEKTDCSGGAPPLADDGGSPAGEAPGSREGVLKTDVMRHIFNGPVVGHRYLAGFKLRPCAGKLGLNQFFPYSSCLGIALFAAPYLDFRSGCTVIPYPSCIRHK